MLENAEDVPGETKPNFVEISGDVKPRRLKQNQTLMELPSMLKLLNMLTPVSSHFKPTKLTQLGVELTKCRKKLKYATTGSRKCGCLFMVSGYQSRQTKEWGLNILNGVHNHAMEPTLEGYILASRLKEDDKMIVRDLTKSKMLPRNILIHLKNKRPHSMTNVKQVYNERQQIWKANRGALQYIISKLDEHNYTYYSRTQSESTTIEDIFWAHPTSVKLFNNFPTILVMNSTYKTNMYKMPMFEVVRVTLTDLTYSVGSEGENSEGIPGLHLGCRTTNRVESAHALVKKYLDNSVGDLGTCWEKIHDMLVLQFTAIQTTFGQSITVLEHRFKYVTLYSGLGCHVSRYVLDNIALEESRCRETLCMDKEISGCVQRTSYRLPCACKIATKLLEEKSILLDEIHHHWHRLRMGEESNEHGFSVEVELKGIVERLKKLPFQMKLEVKEGLRHLAFFETTMMSPPP
ncbi:hypothetical protein MTR_8g020433 [Medicago truncatula]|uniref:Uncharacterized protein n=1 Tax=Medicago truncatula TaxID=3880 RepID=A0A072TLU2_MEDTR|nr:hypothetical protein MTR_8g020433 [Medicago truncatula]